MYAYMHVRERWTLIYSVLVLYTDDTLEKIGLNEMDNCRLDLKVKRFDCFEEGQCHKVTFSVYKTAEQLTNKKRWVNRMRLPGMVQMKRMMANYNYS